MERMVEMCPTTSDRVKPGMSAASIVETVSPIRSAALAHPEPRVRAISCCSIPDLSAITCAASWAMWKGSAFGSSNGLLIGQV